MCVCARVCKVTEKMSKYFFNPCWESNTSQNVWIKVNERLIKHSYISEIKNFLNIHWLSSCVTNIYLVTVIVAVF